MSDTDKEIISQIDQISHKLGELVSLLKKRPNMGLQDFEINHGRQNYDAVLSQLNAILLKLKKGLERNYTVPFPSLPDTLHWEIINEFKKYFLERNKVKSIESEKACGFVTTRKADLWIETQDSKWYWVEIQTMLENIQIEEKLRHATEIGDDDRYAEYVLIFEKAFEKESLFQTTMYKAKGNIKTNKLRIMLYSEGTFETVLEPGDRVSNDVSALFGSSLD